MYSYVQHESSVSYVQHESSVSYVQHESSVSFDDSDSEDLRSYFDSVVKSCDVFRILLVGKSGSGKSTLVSEVFDFDLDKARVQDFLPADHDINEEITSPTKSLCLHDSKGLESGSQENLKIITEFIEDRKGRSFSEQLHAIWYCIEIPVAGQRPFEGGDSALLDSLIKSGNKVPIVMVFTKIDRLEFKEQKRLRAEYISSGLDKTAATKKAKDTCKAAARSAYQTSCVDVLKSKLVPRAWAHYCAVSNKNQDSIVNLIKLTTSTLSQSKNQQIVWASVQMTDIDLKLKMSVEAGKNMYWHGLGATMIPLSGVRRITLLHILGRIHRDIVRIWNNSDPEEVLVGANVRFAIRQLFSEPTMKSKLDGPSNKDAEGDRIIENIGTAITNPSSMAVPAVVESVKLLESVAVGTPATARVLMAYIADLTLGLESLYWLIRPRTDKNICRDDVTRAFTTYRASAQREKVHMLIRDYIGDENVMRAFSRERAMMKIQSIIFSFRFDPTTVIRSSRSIP